MSGRYDFALRQGNSFGLTFRFRDANGALIDLTGSKLVLSVDAGGCTPQHFDLAVSAPVSGEATFRLTPDEARSLPIGALAYEVERVLFGSQTTILTGLVIVERGINNDR